MKSLGEALSGPIITSLQSAGLIPSSQPRGHVGHWALPIVTRPHRQVLRSTLLWVSVLYTYTDEFIPQTYFQSGRSAHPDITHSDTQSSRDEDECYYEGDDSFSIHPERDDNLDPTGGEEKLACFLRESVAHAARKKLVEKHPLSKLQELRPLKMDMPMCLLVPKEVVIHDQWLSKMQITAL